MTYNLPLHPSCKYSYKYPSCKYLESDFSTNNLHCGWPLCDVMKIEYDSSSMVPKYRQSLRIHSFQHVELVVGVEISDIPLFGITSNPTQHKKKNTTGGGSKVQRYTTPSIPMLLHTEEPDPCHRAVAKFTISKFNSPWANWMTSPKVSGAQRL